MEFASANYADAIKKFADWIDATEKRVDSACHCCPTQPPQTQAQLPLQAQQQCQNNTNSSNGISIITTTTNINNNNNNDNNHYHHHHHHQTNGITSTPLATTATTTPPITPNTRLTNSQVSPASHNPQTWKHVILYHQNLQSEVETHGKQLNLELKRHLNENESLGEKESQESNELVERWHKLWLKSLEKLVVVERRKRCPKHNTTIIGKSAPTPGDKSIGRPQRRRPISYPNNYERLEWDYQHTLSLTGCHKENGSQIDLDSIDEQVTKNLTEFGENYEMWFGKEDEIACVPLHSRPPSVEPAEQPEVAKAVVTSNHNSSDDVNCNLLMLTTPMSMLSVDASRCPHKRQRSGFWRVVGPFLFGLALLLFSAIYHEPHQFDKTYYRSRPPAV